MLGAKAAAELDGGLLAELLLLLELPQPASTTTTPIINTPIALPTLDLLIGIG